VAEVHLYRAHKDSLPVVKPGDVVLLRRFKVESLKNKGFGLRSGDASSWAVFEDGGGKLAGENDSGGELMLLPPQIRGPPVEVTEHEATHARYLREWHALLDDKARDRLERATRKIVDAGKTSAAASAK
jgi:hypothetical protein